MRPTHHWPVLLLLGALTFAGHGALAQGTQGSRGGRAPVAPLRSVSGSAYDAATGLPIVRGGACVLIWTTPASLTSRCSPLGGGGRFRIDSLAARRDTVQVSCESGEMYASSGVVRIAVDLREHDSSDIAVPIHTKGCDSRPQVSVTGVFEGFYTPGFESSRFDPCDGGAEAWVIIALDSGVARPRWPRSNRSYSSYYVRWRGTRTGPGRYGHMGVSPYLLTVNRVLEVRRAGKHDCR
jgi:hypothetical protein